MAVDALHTPTTSLLADQRSHWDRGERLPVEHYLKREPDLHQNTEVLLDLIYAEVVLRREAGEDPKADEYVARFPKLEEPIRTQFEVDEAIDDAATQFADTDRTGPDYSVTQPKTPAGYVLMERLGHGGMGVVYKARQLGLDRLVAIKMIRSGELADPMERTRFDAEARAVAKLSHPNIIQIYEVGGTESGPYLALEFVSGKSLADELRDSPYPPRQAATLLSIIARAIEHAHQAGIVHRDLKPANILLADEGSEASPQPKITDFGLAKRMGSDNLTRTGDFLGTPNFASPEQAAGKADVGPGADVYSLGAILYQALTGRPPFSGATPLETLDLVRFSDPVSPSRLRPNIPRDLETIAMCCLRKDPLNRYRSAAALASDLERYLNGQAIQARPVGPIEKAAKWCRRRPTFSGMMALLILLVPASLITVTILWQRAAKARDSESLALEEVTQAREDERTQFERVETRSAELLIANVRYAWLTDDLKAARRALDECPDAFRNTDWAYLDRACSAVRLVIPSGGSVVTAFAYDATGRRLAGMLITGDVAIWDSQTGKTLMSTKVGYSGGPQSLNGLAFLPDGRLVVALSTLLNKTGKSQYGVDLKVLDSQTGQQVGGWQRPGEPYIVQLSRDGRWLIYIEKKARIVTVLETETAKEQCRLAIPPDDLIRALFTANGNQIATKDRVEGFRVWNAETGQLVRQFSGPKDLALLNVLAVAEDGRRTFGALIRSELTNQILVLEPDREVLRLETPLAIIYGFALSPNGELFAAFGREKIALPVLYSRTGKERTILRGFPSAVRAVSFSPDGKELAASYQDGQVVIWKLQALAGE